MKQTIYFTLIVILTSCSAKIISTGIIKSHGRISQVYEDERIITDELKTYLNNSHKKLKVVLRVPNIQANVTEKEDLNQTYNQIEKRLLEHGLIVRDRALLNKLLQNDNIDYESIKKQVDTDIIFEIVDIDLNDEIRATKYINDKNENVAITSFDKGPCNLLTYDNFSTYIPISIAKFEVKLILVEKGQLAGNFTLYQSGLDNFGSTLYTEYSQTTWNKPPTEFSSSYQTTCIKNDNIKTWSNSEINAKIIINNLVDKLAMSLKLSILDYYLDSNSIDKTIELIKTENLKGLAASYSVTEYSINKFGYNLMNSSNLDEALKIFTLNTILNPSSYNTYDSLGECLLKLNRKEEGLKAYKKSLELNPENENTKKILKEQN
jgi:tetratricopeptide (TPR) repeat protein